MNDVKCPACIRRENPTITNSELRARGVTTDDTCPEHLAAFEAMNNALRQAAENTKGAFA